MEISKFRKQTELKRGTPVLPGVWALKRKRCILSGEVYKHKAAMIDTGGSYTMAPQKSDFKENSLRPSNKVVKTYDTGLKSTNKRPNLTGVHLRMEASTPLYH
jgi:hypothetical protein